MIFESSSVKISIFLHQYTFSLKHQSWLEKVVQKLKEEGEGSCYNIMEKWYYVLSLSIWSAVLRTFVVKVRDKKKVKKVSKCTCNLIWLHCCIMGWNIFWRSTYSNSNVSAFLSISLKFRWMAQNLQVD